MPSCHLDVTDARGFRRDGFEERFADVEEAREQCQGMLPDIVREELQDGDLHAITCEVRDEAGRTVCRGEMTYWGDKGSGLRRTASHRRERRPP